MIENSDFLQWQIKYYEIKPSYGLTKSRLVNFLSTLIKCLHTLKTLTYTFTRKAPLLLLLHFPLVLGVVQALTTETQYTLKDSCSILLGFSTFKLSYLL